jgi:RNA recognition motif-containing protein
LPGSKRRFGAPSDPVQPPRNASPNPQVQLRLPPPFPMREIQVTKLFIGNLPFSATEQSVRALFEPHGTIESLALINDRETGRPRGFGFIEMSSADAAKAAQALNGQDFDGRALKVSEAQSKPRNGGGNGYGGGGGRY